MVEYDAVQANCLNWPGKQQNYSTNLNILNKLFFFGYKSEQYRK